MTSELLLAITHMVVFVVGYVIGLENFIKSGHCCEHEECYAMVGEEMRFCTQHRNDL